MRARRQAEDRVKRSGRETSLRRRIIEAARRHFLANGFRNVTMDDLADDLGMSKKTFYAHFPSKRAVLEAVLRQKLDQIGSDLAQATEGNSGNFTRALQRLLDCLQKHMDEIRPPFLRDIQREAPDLFKLVETRRRKFIRQHFGMVLEEGRKAGSIRKDVSVAMIIEILLGAVQAVMTPQKISELGLAPHQCLADVLKVTLEGALTQNGRRPL